MSDLGSLDHTTYIPHFSTGVVCIRRATFVVVLPLLVVANLVTVFKYTSYSRPIHPVKQPPLVPTFTTFTRSVFSAYNTGTTTSM